MSNVGDVIKQYYAGWKEGRPNRSLFTEDFSFKGPMMECNSLDEFIAMAEQMGPGVDEVEVKAEFINGNQACTIIDFVTSAPLKASTPVAEWFTFDKNRIKRIEIFYDARPWAEVVPQE